MSSQVQSGEIKAQEGEIMQHQQWPPEGIKWYYSDDAVAIAHGDCRDVLPSLEPSAIDLVVTSPPFNAGMEYEIGIWETLADYREWLGVSMNALWSVVASGAWVTCEIQDLHVSPEHSHAYPRQKEQFNMATSAYMTVAMLNAGWYYKGEVIWDRGRWMNDMAGKMACAPGSPALLVQHSKVLFFRKPGGRKGVYQFPEQDNTWKARWCRSIWTGVQPAHHPNHPAVMPLAMAYALIQGWSLPLSTILDPFCGSGTTLRAAKYLGRKAIGIEIEEKYCEIAANRCRQMVMEL